MRISRKQLRRIVREATQSTKKYDDDSALKGDQDELPDPLQKAIIDKTVEDREKNESRSRYYNLRQRLRQIIREQCQVVDMSDEISQISSMVDEPMLAGGGGRSKMARGQLFQIARQSQSLHDRLDDADELPQWVQSKIAVMADNMDAVADYLEYSIHRHKTHHDEV